MNREFNKSILLDNIVYLVKEKSLKIGEVEVQAGVSPGYISRNRDGSAKPSIEFIVNISNILNVSIDALLNANFSDLTPTERYLVSFIDKLNRDTVDDKLNWSVENKKQLNALEADNNGEVYHPLFRATVFHARNGDYYAEPYCAAVFPSNTFEGHTSIHGNCFNLKMKNNTYLYLMNVEETKQNEDDVPSVAKEMWMYSPNSGSQFVCSNRAHSELSYLVDMLYSSVEENSRHPKVQKDVKYVIDAFMKDDLENDLPGSPQTMPLDEDLPW